VHYAYDTVALAKVAGNARWSRPAARSWYFLTADYAFGHSLRRRRLHRRQGQRRHVVGSVKHPLNASDFSSFLLQAQSSKAQILAWPTPAATPSTP
jgi:branched-chain amino acid transport system substrate-binding protein